MAQVEVMTSQIAGQSGVSSALASYPVPDASAVSAYALTAANSSPVLATTSAVLYQDREKDLWQTTVILSQTAGECPGSASDFYLETTSPDKTIRASSVTRIGFGPCRVTVKFKGAPRTPQSALLVLDEAGVLSSTQLSLSRDVTWFDYLGVPFICGALMIIALLLVIGFLIRIHEEDGTRKSLIDRQFWTKTVSASDVRKVGLIPVAAIIATFLGAGTLASSLFPGISLSVFGALATVVELIAGGAGVVAYALLYDRWLRHQSPDVIGSTLALPSGSNQPTAITFPEGANITSNGSLSITRDQAGTADQITTEVPASKSISIPDNTTIEILQGKSLSFPDGPNILLKDTVSLLASNDKANLSIEDGPTYPFPVTIKAGADTKITYTNEAEFFPYDAKIVSKFGRRRISRSGRSFKLTPERPTGPVVNMLIVIVPVLSSIFAIGAELGVIGVLSIGLSDATKFGRFIAFDLIVAVALLALYYSVSTIRTATDA
jgi:hypothetical protein